MKHQIESILLSCAIGAALLSGCAVTISPPNSAIQSGQEAEETSPSGEPTLSAPAVSSQPTAEPTPQPTETAEPSAAPSTGNASGDGREYTDLSFLTDEQQRLYTAAYEMRNGIVRYGR